MKRTYDNQFSTDKITVPSFLLTDPDWEDVSWGNEICPRFNNEKLRICVWVDYDSPEDREFSSQLKYTICNLIATGNGYLDIEDNDYFCTDSEANLHKGIMLHTAKLLIIDALAIINSSPVPFETIIDELTTTVALFDEELNQIM